ncbi:MAG: hypothetical protein U0414_16985 [Polyangiaceae bacterium]
MPRRLWTTSGSRFVAPKVQRRLMSSSAGGGGSDWLSTMSNWIHDSLFNATKAPAATVKPIVVPKQIVSTNVAPKPEPKAPAPMPREQWTGSQAEYDKMMMAAQLEGMRSQKGSRYFGSGKHWTHLPPEYVFKHGIPWKGPDWDAARHLAGNEQSAWRGISLSKTGFDLVRSYHPTGKIYGYTVRHPLGLTRLAGSDADELPSGASSPFAPKKEAYGEEAEVSFPSYAPAYSIENAQSHDADGGLGELLKNESYSEDSIMQARKELDLK